MTSHHGARAAHVKSLINGRAFDPGRSIQRANVRVRTEIIDMAVAVGLCSDYGKAGTPSISSYVEDLLIEAVRERRELQKKVSVEKTGKH